MIELSFEDFHEQNYDHQDYCLYVLKNGLGDILYIGISKNNIWERWFGWGGHVTCDMGWKGHLWRIAHRGKN